MRRLLPVFLPIFALSTGVGVFVGLAEPHSKRAMCKDAASHGVDHIYRVSFLQSLKERHERRIGNLHAAFKIGDQNYVGSYYRGKYARA